MWLLTGANGQAPLSELPLSWLSNWAPVDDTQYPMISLPVWSLSSL